MKRRNRSWSECRPQTVFQQLIDLLWNLILLFILSDFTVIFRFRINICNEETRVTVEICVRSDLQGPRYTQSLGKYYRRRGVVGSSRGLGRQCGVLNSLNWNLLGGTTSLCRLPSTIYVRSNRQWNPGVQNPVLGIKDSLLFNLLITVSD